MFEVAVGSTILDGAARGAARENQQQPKQTNKIEAKAEAKGETKAEGAAGRAAGAAGPPPAAIIDNAELPPVFADLLHQCKKFLGREGDSMDKTSWKFLRVRCGLPSVEVARYRKELGGTSNVVCVRGKTRFPATIKPRHILDLVLDVQQRFEWDSMLKSGRVAKRFASAAAAEEGEEEEGGGEEEGGYGVKGKKKEKPSGEDIIRLAYKGAPMVSPRDLCLLRGWGNDLTDLGLAPERKGCYLVAQSVIDDVAVPEAKGHVRASLSECGYLFEEMEDGTVEATYISSLDFRGKIPYWFSNIIVEQQPDSLKAMRRVLLKRQGEDPGSCAVM